MAMADRMATAVHTVMAIHKLVRADHMAFAEHSPVAARTPMVMHNLEEDTTAAIHKHYLEMLEQADIHQQLAITC